MGYKLSSLLSLPLETDVSFYIFSIGDEVWEGGLQELVNKNFDKLALEIGPQNIIVGGLEFGFHGEVVEKYLGKCYKDLKNELPALLITDTHPEELNKDSMRWLIPLEKARDNYGRIDRFLSDLVDFVQRKSDNLVTMFEMESYDNQNQDEPVKIKSPYDRDFVVFKPNKVLPRLKSYWE